MQPQSKWVLLNVYIRHQDYLALMDLVIFKSINQILILMFYYMACLDCLIVVNPLILHIWELALLIVPLIQELALLIEIAQITYLLNQNFSIHR